MKALSKDSKLVRSTNLPREIWVLRTVGSQVRRSSCYALPVLAFFAATCTPGEPSWHSCSSRSRCFLEFVLLIGVGLLLAPLAVLVRRRRAASMSIVLRMLFYFSPIIYGLST